MVAEVRDVWVWGPAAGSCVMTGAACRHTPSGGGQGKQRVPGPTGQTGSCGSLAISMYSCDGGVLPWVHAWQ